MYISLDDDGMTLYLMIFYDAQAFGLLVNDILSLLVYIFFLFSFLAETTEACTMRDTLRMQTTYVVCIHIVHAARRCD